MPTTDDIRWFKQQFGSKIDRKVRDTRSASICSPQSPARRPAPPGRGFAKRGSPSIGSSSCASVIPSTRTGAGARFRRRRRRCWRSATAIGCSRSRADARGHGRAHSRVPRDGQKPEQVLSRVRDIPVRPPTLREGARLLSRAALHRLRRVPGQVYRGARERPAAQTDGGTRPPSPISRWPQWPSRTTRAGSGRTERSNRASRTATVDSMASCCSTSCLSQSVAVGARRPARLPAPMPGTAIVALPTPVSAADACTRSMSS